MRPLSITAGKPLPPLAGLLCIAALWGRPAAEGCVAGRGLTSNDIRWLVGSGDTLCMVTSKDGHPALNVIAGAAAINDPAKENNWWSYTLGCRKTGIYDLAFGGGMAVASLDSAPNVVWTYTPATSRTEESAFPWPRDSARQFTVSDAVYAAGSFYFACLDGGLVGWNPATKAKTVFLPGIRGGRNLAALQPGDLPAPDTARRVSGVEIVKEDSLLLVVTPERLWRFSPGDSSWDSSVTATLADDALRFRSFDYVFVNRLDRSRPMYAVITARYGNDGEDSTMLFKYHRPSGRWQTMFNQAPKSLTFGTDGYCYMLFDDYRPGTSLFNIIRVYRDTLGDSGTLLRPQPVIPDDRIHNRMTRAHDIDVPDVFNDILFIPRTDSTGYLWIATSEGLFFSRNETPSASGTDTASFILIKRAPAVAAGLKKTYARPGILTPAVSSCKFIYNIAASKANVTIKIYDYNMDLVTTVIENRPRLSGQFGGPLGRSTVESEDSWDGTNSRGRPVAPGVYYYKITTDSGERAFGKIVVAR